MLYVPVSLEKKLVIIGMQLPLNTIKEIADTNKLFTGFKLLSWTLYTFPKYPTR